MVTNGNECFLAYSTPFILSSAGRTMAVWFWREGKFISFLCASFFGERDACYLISRHNGLPKRIDHQLNYKCQNNLQLIQIPFKYSARQIGQERFLTFLIFSKVKVFAKNVYIVLQVPNDDGNEAIHSQGISKRWRSDMLRFEFYFYRRNKMFLL